MLIPLHLIPVLLLLGLIGVIVWGVLRLSRQAPAGAVAAQAVAGPPAALPIHDPAQEELRLPTLAARSTRRSSCGVAPLLTSSPLVRETRAHSRWKATR